jgi:hypothetical protein
VESNAGLLVIASLFLAVTGWPPSDVGRVDRAGLNVSTVRALRHRARTHARKLMVDATGAGLVRRTSGSETVVVLPSLIEAIGDIFAAMFAIQAHCADAAVEEIGSAS